MVVVVEQEVEVVVVLVVGNVDEKRVVFVN